MGRSPSVWLALLVAATGCGAAPVAGPGSAAGVRRCLVLSTNDSEAHFDGERSGPPDRPVYQGTIARVAAAKAAALAARPGGVLLVEGGDVLQGRFMERADGDRARAMREAWQVYEAAGYDFATLGNHEFDAGPRNVRFALQGLARLRVLTANLAADGTALDPREEGRGGGLYGRTAIATCGGIRVGLFGLLTPSTKTISQMGAVGFPPDPVTEPARAAVAELRAAGAEVVVALTHLGVGDDVALARDVSGIDAIVGGHSHTALHTAKVVGSTWITQTGARFAFLGQLDLGVGGDGRVDPARSSWKLQAIDGAMPHDPAIAARVDALRAALVEEVVIGERKVAWDLTRPRGDYGRRACRAAALASRRALPELTRQAPIVGAMINTGGLRSHTVYPPGPVTNLDIAAIHPFRNRLVVVALSGQGLRDALEHGCAPGSDGHGQGLVMWGLDYACDRDKPAQTYTVVDGRPIAILRRGERLTRATVAGQPIDPTARYAIATVDYLARGGSGYLPLALADHYCLDGHRDTGDGSCRSPLFTEIVEAAVRSGELDAPLDAAR